MGGENPLSRTSLPNDSLPGEIWETHVHDPHDATKASGEMCMLETVTKHNMIHFSQNPENTQEDVVYYLNPATFIASGLDMSKLPRHPKELGKMKPLEWYYYDGTYVEPHRGSQLNKEFVIMTVDVK